MYSNITFKFSITFKDTSLLCDINNRIVNGMGIEVIRPSINNVIDYDDLERKHR